MGGTRWAHGWRARDGPGNGLASLAGYPAVDADAAIWIRVRTGASGSIYEHPGVWCKRCFKTCVIRTGYARAIADQDDFTARATAWLDTVAPEVLATVQDDAPRSTIIPAFGHSTAGSRAMEVLAKLSHGALAATSQLKQGAVIGEGGMGVIREAEQVALGRSVAVKTLKPSRRDPAAALDLLREAWVTGAIEHPNVVPVHYLELDPDGIPVIVLKRIDGVEWSVLIDDAAEVERRFGATDLLAWNLGILLQVLNAVRFAHSRGVVHRDLKPSNVMIGDFGEVYLLDWGIAVSLRDDGSGRLPLAALATQLAGTPCYMAPEMLGREGDPGISERTDIYLAGAVLFELITGRPPHEGTTAVAVFASVIAGTPTLPASVPPELARICARAMHEDPAARFESADALRLAIQRYLEHRGSADLASRANLRLAELAALLATPIRAASQTEHDLDAAADDETAQREAIYRLFGACRFGYHEALAVWPDNTDAHAGLARATTAVAEYELATGDPKAAVTLLGELADAPAALVARARAAADIASRHQAGLEKLRRAHDSNTGRRTRTFIALALGLSFTVLPLVNLAMPDRLALQTHRGNVLWALGALIAFGAIVFWARETMRKTIFNRSLAAIGMFVFVGQIALSLGAEAVGITVPQSQVFMIFYWGAVTWLIVISLDRWLWPAAITYFIGFGIAAAFPEHRHHVMAATNFSFTLNAVIRWRPATFTPTLEERAAMARSRSRSRARHATRRG